MDHTHDFDRRLRKRLRNERLWLLKKSDHTLRRLERNPYSQKGVAQRIGVCAETLRRWEQGSGAPTLDQWDAWCAELYHDFSALLTELFRNTPE